MQEAATTGADFQSNNCYRSDVGGGSNAILCLPLFLQSIINSLASERARVGHRWYTERSLVDLLNQVSRVSKTFRFSGVTRKKYADLTPDNICKTSVSVIDYRY